MSVCVVELSVICWAACQTTVGQLSSAADCRQEAQSAPLGSSTEGMQIHFDLLSAAQHPHGGVEAPWRDHHFPPAHQLPVPCEEHLQDRMGATVR